MMEARYQGSDPQMLPYESCFSIKKRGRKITVTRQKRRSEGDG